MKKHLCKIENGQLFYQRLTFPKFTGEVKMSSDGSYIMDTNTIIFYEDKLPEDAIYVAKIMREAGDFIAEFIKK